MSSNVDPLSQSEAWELVNDVEYAHHFTVWKVILELERDGCNRINSTNVRDEVRELSGEFRERRHVLRSMNRLRDAGVLDRRRPPTTDPDGTIAQPFFRRSTQFEA